MLYIRSVFELALVLSLIAADHDSGSVEFNLLYDAIAFHWLCLDLHRFLFMVIEKFSSPRIVERLHANFDLNQSLVLPVIIIFRGREALLVVLNRMVGLLEFKASVSTRIRFSYLV